MQEASDRIVVVGGGILGVATARELQVQGESVLLLTEGEVADGASGRSLSWLNSLAAPSVAYHELRMAGLDRYHRFAADHPGSDRFLHFDGGVHWPGTDEKPLDQAVAHAAAMGYRHTVLSPSDATRAGLGLNEAALPAEGVLFTPDDGWVDLPSLIAVLLAEFRAAGGEVRAGVGRVVVDAEAGQVHAVRYGDVVLPVGRVVVATGPAVPAMVAEVGFDLPDRTPVSVLVRTHPVDVSLRPVVNSPRIAVRRNVGGNLVLDRSWAEAHVTTTPEGYSIPDEVVDELLAEASHVLAGTPRLSAASVGIGPKPIPGDGFAVVGELPHVAGYHLAFTHSGATLGLILGEQLAAGVRGLPTPLLDEFGPDRFSRMQDGD